MNCQAVTLSGDHCQAPALEGRPWCFHHDPERAPERAAARRRGGLASHGLDFEAAPPEVRVESVGDVLALLGIGASDILRQKPSLARARAIAYLAGSILKALEVGELEARISALERREEGWRCATE